ncbi:MAG: OsmC family protein [Bacteroidia bacterium]
MATIKTVYTGDLRTRALHLASGTEIITDAPVDNQGKGEAFSPTDLLSAALGSCMLTIMGIAARTHAIRMEDTVVEITKIMASNPRRVSEVQIVFQMPDLVYTEKEKAILEHAARTCPVALSVHPDLQQTISFIWKA